MDYATHACPLRLAFFLFDKKTATGFLFLFIAPPRSCVAHACLSIIDACVRDMLRVQEAICRRFQQLSHQRCDVKAPRGDTLCRRVRGVCSCLQKGWKIQKSHTPERRIPYPWKMATLNIIYIYTIDEVEILNLEPWTKPEKGGNVRPAGEHRPRHWGDGQALHHATKRAPPSTILYNHKP